MTEETNQETPEQIQEQHDVAAKEPVAQPEEKVTEIVAPEVVADVAPVVPEETPVPEVIPEVEAAPVVQVVPEKPVILTAEEKTKKLFHYTASHFSGNPVGYGVYLEGVADYFKPGLVSELMTKVVVRYDETLGILETSDEVFAPA